MINLYIARTHSRITSEMFIKYIVNTQLGIKSEKLVIQKNKYGKPFLVDYPNIHYNISHTKGLIVCAISNNYVGIDVERIRNFNRLIPKKFFTENERSYIFCKEKDTNKRFFEVWTKKEAYAKWVGQGMELPLTSYDVLDKNRIITNYLEDYVISICSAEKLLASSVMVKYIYDTIT